MKRPRSRIGFSAASGRRATLGRAFDELRFGAARTLNLREILPTPELAATRTRNWLKEQQVAGSGEVLVITGRGNSSPGGVSPVRQAVLGLATPLRREGVILGVAEHNPGAFVFQLAPITSLLNSPRSRRHPTPPAPLNPKAFAGLTPRTLTALRELAQRSLEQLGIHAPTDAVLVNEMERRFSLLAVALGDQPGRELRLQRAIQAAIREMEDQ